MVTAFDSILNTSYVQHHFTKKKYILVTCTSTVPTLRDDTSWGSKPPYLHVGKFKSLQIWCVGRGVLWLLILDTAVQIICTFSCSICINDLGKLRLIQCMGKPVLNHWQRIEWENMH